MFQVKFLNLLNLKEGDVENEYLIRILDKIADIVPLHSLFLCCKSNCGVLTNLFWFVYFLFSVVVVMKSLSKYFIHV